MTRLEAQVIADEIHEAAAAVPASKWFGDKVFLADIAERLDVKLESIAGQLIAAHQLDAIVLARFDLTPVYGGAEVARSEIKHENATMHVVVMR